LGAAPAGPPSAPSRGAAVAVPPGCAEDVLHDVRRMTALWQSGLLSNFHYLDFLNCAAGRSQNDFSQYPVFPWVLQDYGSEKLRLDDPSVYRDLSKPVGALSAKRLEYFKERMVGMSEDERFLYGTHYSTPAYVIYWLLRAMPERMLRLHNGHFDAMPRLFRSLPESWESVNESTASLMELIPEFFVLPAEWLVNALGIITTEGPLLDVQLPRWAEDVVDFVCKMRAALESDWVSRNLPAWIDLIFGCKQSGEEALRANNLFHPVCYAGTRGGQPTATPDLPLSVLETQLQEFGRVPRQLFDEAHPPRLKIPAWEPERLRKDPVQSEPWYKAVRHLSSSSTSDAAEASSAGSSAASAAARSGAASGSAPSSAPGARSGAASQVGPPTSAVLRALCPRESEPFAATGQITGVAGCSANAYSVGDDGCLRVGPLPFQHGPGGPEGDPPPAVLRRNFRVSPMPLCALAVLNTDLLAIGGHDNAVTLYSSSCGSALARCQVHADTVTCFGLSPCRSVLISGSRDQSVRSWTVTPSSLKSDSTFDDVQQPITCVAAGTNLILAGADDGQLMAWDRRSGQPVMDRELGGMAIGCALHRSEHLAMALDDTGELRLWDLRRGCESLRLCVLARAGGGSLGRVRCFLTDFEGWAVLGGADSGGAPAVALWDIPEQRELRTWQLDGPSRGGDVQFLVRPLAPSPQADEDRGPASFFSASAKGAIHAFAPRDHAPPAR